MSAVKQSSYIYWMRRCYAADCMRGDTDVVAFRESLGDGMAVLYYSCNSVVDAGAWWFGTSPYA